MAVTTVRVGATPNAACARKSCVAHHISFPFILPPVRAYLLRLKGAVPGDFDREPSMGKRDDLIAQYADDLKNKCSMTPDMGLLTKVTIGCGPAIYNADASTVAGSQESELDTVKEKFLMKKLGLADGPELMAAINKVIEIYGKSERNKYRAVVYYMLTKHFGKESVYN
ncbi:MAG: hypothetical protein ACI8TF_002750 [Paracoccaceae bacterium]|jgi:hypothetical protein